MTVFVKHQSGAPTGFFAWEVAGLRWLSGVDGGMPCAQVVSFDAVSLTLRRLDSVTPSPEAAYTFSSRLAVTHDAGAALFGCPHYDVVLAGYQRVRALKPGWRNRIRLHQLFPLLAHVVLFGGGYAGQTHAAARTALAG